MRLILSLVLALQSVPAIWAQVSVGVQAGPVTSVLRQEVELPSGPIALDADAFTGYHFGIPVHVSLGERWILGAGAHYLTLGERRVLSLANGDPAESTTTYRTIEAPVTLGYRLPLGGVSLAGVSLAGRLGPAVQFTHAYRSRVTGSGGTESQHVQLLRDELRRFSLHATAAVEVAAGLPFGEAYLEVRARQQLSDLAEPEAATWRFQAIAPALGLRMSIGGAS